MFNTYEWIYGSTCKSQTLQIHLLMLVKPIYCFLDVDGCWSASSPTSLFNPLSSTFASICLKFLNFFNDLIFLTQLSTWERTQCDWICCFSQPFPWPILPVVILLNPLNGGRSKSAHLRQIGHAAAPRCCCSNPVGSQAQDHNNQRI